jgi:transcriptional regulator with XRE-family HTH domain
MIVKNITANDKKKLIKALLVAKGIKFADLAKNLGVSSAAISRIIAGASISFRIQKAISDVLSIPFEELWGDNYRISENERKGNVKNK